MIGKKSGKNCAKKFVLVQKKDQFQELNSVQGCTLWQKKVQQQIVVPSFTQIHSLCVHKNNKIPQNYIKTFNIKKFMSNQHYQLDEIDLCFLSKLNLDINEPIFSQIIKSFQKYAYKFGTQLNYKKIIMKVLKKHRMSQKAPGNQSFLRQIYNYWRNKRKNMRSPLLRIYWNKTQVGPYKLREQTSLCLRNRTIKVQPNVAREILKEDLLALKKILLLMKNREIQQRKLLIDQTKCFQKLSKEVLKKVEKLNKKQKQKQQKRKGSKFLKLVSNRN